MPESIMYCDRCGRMIHAQEMKAGQVIITPTASICSSCAKQMPPDQKRSMQSGGARRTPTPAPGGRRPSRRISGRGTASSRRVSDHNLPAQEGEGGGGSRTVLAVASAAAVALLVVAVALLMKGGGNDAKKGGVTAPTPPPPVAVPVVQVATPAADPAGAETQPAAAAPAGDHATQFSQIRAMDDPSLGRYDDIRSAVKDLVAKAEGKPVADEATKFMADVDARYNKMADEAYWSATERAYALVSMSKFDQAAAAVRSVRSRFGGSAWSEIRGDERIATILKKIESRRAEVGDESIASAKDAIDAEDFAKARAALENRSGWPTDQRDRADKLMVELREKEEKWQDANAKDRAWVQFIVKMTVAGAKGIDEVEKFTAAEQPRLREMGLDKKLYDIKRRFRDAKMVHSLVEDGLRNARGVVRLKQGDRPVAGKVVDVDTSTLTLKPSVGKNIKIPLGDIPPEDLVKASGISRGGAVKKERIAAYYLVRGAVSSAQALVSDLVSDDAEKLKDELDEIAKALADAAKRDEPTAVATAGDGGDGQPAAEAGAAVTKGIKETFSSAKRVSDTWDLGTGWEVKSGALEKAAGGVQIVTAGSPPGKSVTVEVVVTPRKAEKSDNWKLCGPAIVENDRNFWALSLVESPDGKHHVELKENMNGVWQSEIMEETRLTMVSSDGMDWEYDKQYVMKIVMTPKGIAGHITDKAADETIKIEYLFDNKAVTSGKPALRSYGLPAKFDNFVADVMTTEALVKAEKAKEILPTGPKEPLPNETGKPGQWAPGLIAEYFIGRDFKNRVAVRVDPAGVNHFYGNGAFPSLKKVHPPFKVRWTGYVMLPYKAAYIFSGNVNGEMEVEIDGMPLLTRKSKSSPELKLDAGLHHITAVYHCDDSWWREVRLLWMPMGKPKSIIPASCYFHEVPELGAYGPPSEFMDGLWAEVYSDTAFKRKVWEGPMGAPDFDFGSGSPVAGTPKDNFSVRLTGYMISVTGEEYTMRAVTTDSVRVKLDGDVVIDAWGAADAGKRTTARKIKGGLREFEVEYMHKTGNARLAVYWKPTKWGGETGTERVAKCFTKARPLTIVDRRGTAPGLSALYYNTPKPGKGGYFKQWDGAPYFRWGDGSPAPNIPGKTFSAIWKGSLFVPVSGVHRFRIYREGGVRFAVGGKQVINKWSDNDAWEEVEVPLRKGKTPLNIVFFSASNRVELRAYWSGPKFTMRPIGAESIAHGGSLRVAKKVKRPAAGQVASTPIAIGAGGRAKVELPPQGNIIVNGGFEEIDTTMKFASRWTKYNWGPGGGQYSVRIDKTNGHDSDQSLVTRGLSDGALPGAFTTVRLPPGKYEIRFWALADFDVKGRVHAYVAGKEVGSASVGDDDWEQVTFPVIIRELQRNASVRIWTSTPKSRVWFDGVELENTP